MATYSGLPPGRYTLRRVPDRSLPPFAPAKPQDIPFTGPRPPRRKAIDQTLWCQCCNTVLPHPPRAWYCDVHAEVRKRLSKEQHELAARKTFEVSRADLLAFHRRVAALEKLTSDLTVAYNRDRPDLRPEVHAIQMAIKKLIDDSHRLPKPPPRPRNP